MENKPHILVTGANGFVGSMLARHLAGAGNLVRAAVRNPGTIITNTCEQVSVGGIDDNTHWETALRGIDVVVHVAGRAHIMKEDAADPLQAFRTVNRDATLCLARQALRASVRRFVFISTIGVNGFETHGRPLTVEDAPRPHSFYARSKAEAEVGLREMTTNGPMEHVIIRPPLILGTEPKGNLGTLLRALRVGAPMPFASITRNRRDLVSLETLADLVAATIDHKEAANRTFLISDGRAVSTRQIIERLAHMHGLSPRLFSLPSPLLAASLRLIGKSSLASQLCGDLEIDITHTRETLNWEPPIMH